MQSDSSATSDNHIDPTDKAPATFTPPVFHNPLAAGYEVKVSQLPDLPKAPSLPETQPEPEATFQPTSAESAMRDPALAGNDQAGLAEGIEPVMTGDAPVIHPAAYAPLPTQIPTPVYQPAPSHTEAHNPLEEHDPWEAKPVVPAPFRLAPESKLAHIHSQPHPPYGSPVDQSHEHTAPQRAPEASKSPPHKLSPRLFLVVGVLIAGLLVAAAWTLGVRNKASRPATPSQSAGTTRDTTESGLIVGNERILTPCYTIQVPKAPRTDINKDCQLSVAYGPDKISNIVVSTINDFNLVEPVNQTGSNQSPRFDSQKVLEALITNTTSGKAVSAREKIKVGNIDAVKITGSAQAGGDALVAYTFIILPSTDQQFAEKQFIAMIVTGAYNDDYSRKAFNGMLETWTWK
ncbi:MAG: hypothetical protein WCI47_00970 [bacterium]